MKRISLLLIISLFSAILQAQSAFTNEINKSLEAVIGDYPNLYKNIKGELVGQNGNTMAYTSRVEIPGSVSTAVTINSSFIKDDVNWKSVLFKSKDFKNAKEKFQQYFSCTKNGIIDSETDRPYILSANYKEPQPSGATHIHFQLLPATIDVRNLVVELFMDKIADEWVISLSVYNR